MNDFNSEIINEFRGNHGVVGGHFEGKNLLILHVIGKKTGTERLYPLVYTTDGDALLVAGSLGGAPNDPVWVGNVEVMTEATIEVGDSRLTTKPTVLREGAERDRLYAKLVDYWPDFLEYEKKTTRVFPIIRLDPIS
jgi:deazaflavin-dependent oxidoreductase (nitroreductase family)